MAALIVAWTVLPPDSFTSTWSLTLCLRNCCGILPHANEALRGPVAKFPVAGLINRID